MNQMKKYFWIILISVLCVIPGKVTAASTWPDESFQNICNMDKDSAIKYNVDGEVRYLFCNTTWSGLDFGENDVICKTKESSLGFGTDDAICYDRATNTITLKNFKGKHIEIGKNHASGLKLVLEGENTLEPDTGSVVNGALIVSSSTEMSGSGTLTINNSNVIHGIEVGDNARLTIKTHGLSINTNVGCISESTPYASIYANNGNVYFDNSTVNIKVSKNEGASCSSYSGYAIYGNDAHINIGNDEHEYNNTLNITTNLSAIKLDNDSTFDIEENVTIPEYNLREKADSRDAKVLINYNSTNESVPLIDVSNSTMNIEGWMKISADQSDPSARLSMIYDNPILLSNSSLKIYEDGAFMVSAAGNESIIKLVGSKIETDGMLVVENISPDNDTSILLVDNDNAKSTLNVGRSSCNIEQLNIVNGAYKDSKIKWTYGNKLLWNKVPGRPVYVNSKKSVHYGWLSTDSVANTEVTLSGIASTNILDKGLAKLTKYSSLETDDIFALPTKDNTYQILTRMDINSTYNKDNLKLHLLKLEGNNYVQVGETLTTKAGTLKVGTMSELVYDESDMEDYTGLSTSSYLYYSFELTAEQLSSGIYYILETTETKTYFEDESSAKTGIRLYPPKALSSKYKFFATSNLNNDIESKIESEIYNLGFPSIDIKKINYYEFSFSADNIVAPDGVYKIKLPTHGDYGSEAQIYAFNSSGSKLDRKIAATIEDNYYVFEINKSDLDNTIFALIDFPEINSLKDSTGKYILTAGHNRIYSGCKFIVNIGSQSVSGNVTQDNKSFELRCGDNYTLPDIVYSIIIPKPNGTSPKLYDGVNISTAKEVSLTPKTEDKLSFDVSNTDIDKTPTTYALTYTNACSTVTQTKYKINFNTDGGNTISEETVTIGSAGKTLPTPTKTGYTFDYWQYSDGTKVTATKTTEVLRDADKIIEKDSNGCSTEYYKTIELKAVWKQNSGCNDAEMNFKVIYNVDGGNPISEETVTSSTTKNIPIPTKNDHKFLGWYSDSAKTKKITATKLKDLASPRKDGSTCITGYNDVTLYASWEKITTYTVTFDTDGGTPVPASQTIEANGKVNKPTDPTKTGYAFKEWQLNNVTYDFSKVVTSNITLKAVWTENSNCKKVNKEFKLTYYGDSTSHTISESTTDKLPTEATTSKEGYSFKGWCYDEACTKPINSETLLKDLIVTPIKDSDDRCTTGYQDLTIYPKFEKNSVEPEEPGCSDADLIVSLVYNTNGGNELPQNNKALDIKFNELAIPVRSGYTFAGWYLDEELTTKLTEELWKKEQQERYEFVSKDPACRLALIALYANWTKNETEVVSVGGAKITHELIDDASKFNFVVDQLTENETAFVSGILENAKKTAAPKKVIDIYKFNLTGKEEGTVLPGGKYQIKLPITDLMNKYDQLEFAILDEKGNITDQYYSLTKDGDYYVITINYEDLGKTNFALIGNEIKQVSTGIPFKVGAFTILIAGFGYVSYKVKKKNKLFKI